MNRDDFAKDLERQRNARVEITKHQTVVQRLQVISEQIQAFENRYGGTFQDAFGQLSDVEIDAMSEAVDIGDWKGLIEARKRLIEEYDRDDIPDGIYAVSPDPNHPRVQVRRLYEYCRERGLSPSQLSESEMKQFLVYPNRDREHENQRE